MHPKARPLVCHQAPASARGFSCDQFPLSVGHEQHGCTAPLRVRHPGGSPMCATGCERGQRSLSSPGAAPRLGPAGQEPGTRAELSRPCHPCLDHAISFLSSLSISPPAACGSPSPASRGAGRDRLPGALPPCQAAPGVLAPWDGAPGTPPAPPAPRGHRQCQEGAVALSLSSIIT